MAIPTYNSGSTGSTDATGAWSHTGPTPTAIGNVLILHVLQDGNTNGAVTVTSVTNMEQLDGTDGNMDKIVGGNADSSFQCGNPAAAREHVWIGRSTSTSAPVVTGGNSTSEDVYVQMYDYDTVNTGTTIASVIENGSAGATVSDFDTNTGCRLSDCTTLGPDRLMIFLNAMDDDTTFSNISSDNPAIIGFPDLSFSSASGTDGRVDMFAIPQVTAGTQVAGFGTISPSASWGSLSFALIGTTVSGQPRPPGVNFNDPGFFMRGLRRAWHRRESGIFVPELGWSI